MIENEIFDEIRRRKIRAGHVWRFQHYNPFKYDCSNPNQFDACMTKFCEQGIFEAQKDGSVTMYRLTNEGEKLIYSEND